MNDARDLATGPTGLAAAHERSSAVVAPHPLRHCEVLHSLEAARAPWAELEGLAAASPYQSYDFVDAWLQTTGRAKNIEAMIVVARDETGRVNAVLPLGRLRRGPIWTGEFLGGKDANFKMGLFRPGVAGTGEAIVDLLRRAARMTTPRVDVFWLTNQPHSWQGAANPMIALPHQPSPSFGHKSALDKDFNAWLGAHYSKDAQKKLRKKMRRLGESGRVAPVVAHDKASARKIIAAFLRQKEAHTRARGAANSYGNPHTAEFFDVAATKNLAENAPTIELHALMSGERIVATLGGLPQAGRFSGIFLSYDTEPEIARCSPGQLLVLEAIRNLSARGFTTFDLGVGEARYKDENCEADEPLFDAAVGVTAIGSAFGAAALRRQQIKRWIKQTPWAWTLADKLRRRALFLRGGRGSRAASGGPLDA